jgi:glycosyltransferase involved in cell wall biosynthesis
MAALKVLVVGDPGSIHATRFVSLLQEEGHKVILFQPELWYSQEEHLRGVDLRVVLPYESAQQGNAIRSSHPLLAKIFLFLAKRFPSLLTFAGIFSRQMRPRFAWRAKALARLIRSEKPDIIFTLKMQNEAYVMAEAAQRLSPQDYSNWVHFSWGSDFEFFAKNEKTKGEHLPRVQQAMKVCPFLLSDCARDQKQAENFGFRGKKLGTCLAPGGFKLSELEPLRKKLSERKIILVKGRQGMWVGRAFQSLAAFEKVDPELLKGYRILIAMPSPEVRAAVDYLKITTKIPFEILPKLSYADLLALYGQSRITISASDVDGTPSFLIESMALGAFPIHTDMDSVREWINPGENGLLFDNEKIPQITAAIERALRDNELVESAAQKNFAIAQKRMDRNQIGPWLTQVLRREVLGEKTNG